MNKILRIFLLRTVVIPYFLLLAMTNLYSGSTGANKEFEITDWYKKWPIHRN